MAAGLNEIDTASAEWWMIVVHRLLMPRSFRRSLGGSPQNNPQRCWKITRTMKRSFLRWDLPLFLLGDSVSLVGFAHKYFFLFPQFLEDFIGSTAFTMSACRQLKRCTPRKASVLAGFSIHEQSDNAPNTAVSEPRVKLLVASPRTIKGVLPQTETGWTCTMGNDGNSSPFYLYLSGR